MILAKELDLKAELHAFKVKLEKVDGCTLLAKAYIATSQEGLDAISNYRDGCEFLKLFERSVLSPDSLKQLKKETGVEYFQSLVRVSDVLSPILNAVSDNIAKSNNMALAAHPDELQPVTPAKKARKAAKRHTPRSS